MKADSEEIDIVFDGWSFVVCAHFLKVFLLLLTGKD